jgi:hypothetical protein
VNDKAGAPRGSCHRRERPSRQFLVVRSVRGVQLDVVVREVVPYGSGNDLSLAGLSGRLVVHEKHSLNVGHMRYHREHFGLVDELDGAGRPTGDEVTHPRTVVKSRTRYVYGVTQLDPRS